MIPIIRWNLWQRRWSIFWWCVGVSAFIVINLVFYPSFRDQANLNQSLQNLPQAAKSFFSDTGDFFSPQGYLSSQVFYLMLPLLLGILTIGLGSSLIAKEEDSGSIELLLARPISRARLIAGKAATGLIILLIVGGVSLATVLLMCRVVDMNVPLAGVAVATLMAIVLAATFGSIAFAVTMLGKTARLASIGISTLLAFGGYIIASLANIASWLEWPAKFLPYHYYHPGNALHGRYDWINAAGLIVVVVILGIVSWLAFRRRDLSG